MNINRLRANARVSVNMKTVLSSLPLFFSLALFLLYSYLYNFIYAAMQAVESVRDSSTYSILSSFLDFSPTISGSDPSGMS